jgi:hypothetical protein
MFDGNGDGVHVVDAFMKCENPVPSGGELFTRDSTPRGWARSLSHAGRLAALLGTEERFARGSDQPGDVEGRSASGDERCDVCPPCHLSRVSGFPSFRIQATGIDRCPI